MLNQSYYIKKIIEKFNKYDDTPTRTPIDKNLHLSKNTGHRIFIVGILAYNQQSNVSHELCTSLYSVCSE